MHRRTPIFLLLLFFCLQLPAHGPAEAKDLWLEMEKGLRLCGVEIKSYRSSCFVDRAEQERIISAGAAPDCGCSMRSGFEDDEILFEICGADRGRCARLWERFVGAAGRCGGAAGRTWGVEGFHEPVEDLSALGEELVQALGGQLRQINNHPRMVQLLADLPWGGVGILLEQGPVNLALELSEDTYLHKVKVRLGIPVLFSLSNG